MLIFLAIQNRQLSVHAGSELQKTYGLMGQTIDRKLVTPHFIPQARAGNYVQRVSLLIDRIEEWISSIAQQQAAVRTQEIKQIATTIVASREKLYADIQLQIKYHPASGYNLTTQQLRAKQAYDKLALVAGQIDHNPTQAQQTSANTLDELRQVSMNQFNARRQLDRAEEYALEIARQIDQHRAAGLAVIPA